MTKNQAAWINGPRVKPLKVAEAPDWKAGPGEVVIKNAALAIVSKSLHETINNTDHLCRTQSTGLSSKIPSLIERE